MNLLRTMYCCTCYYRFLLPDLKQCTSRLIQGMNGYLNRMNKANWYY